jgi:hypothetical protein
MDPAPPVFPDRDNADRATAARLNDRPTAHRIPPSRQGKAAIAGCAGIHPTKETYKCPMRLPLAVTLKFPMTR